MCHTAKAYFPDRQSCSTLCRQPSGCARSVEVVAVYPSLGSYSVVGLFRWASPPFKKPFTLNAKKSCKIYTLSRKIFAPSPIPNEKGHFLSLFHKFFAKNNACHKGKRKKSHLQFVSGTNSFCLLSNNHFIGFSQILCRNRFFHFPNDIIGLESV